ncbi:MAG: hypothetical protein KAI80_09000, partial [Hyphomicrobiaceae bacterium]|nr:hypothetical protein [Hyphomicrobiaceae bacterium]
TVPSGFFVCRPGTLVTLEETGHHRSANAATFFHRRRHGIGGRRFGVDAFFGRIFVFFGHGKSPSSKEWLIELKWFAS